MPQASPAWCWASSSSSTNGEQRRSVTRLDTFCVSIYPSSASKNRILRNQIHRKPARREIMQRTASAVRQGALKSGKRFMSPDSGDLKRPQYAFSTRFENGLGTNPEE